MSQFDRNILHLRQITREGATTVGVLFTIEKKRTDCFL